MLGLKKVYKADEKPLEGIKLNEEQSIKIYELHYQ